MEITWLEDLMELASSRNFSMAATARNITQPAFSRRVRALENWVGTQLVDRSTYPVKLTQAGEMVLERARDLSDQMYRLRDECRDMARADADTLSVSALHSIALSIYPEYSKALQAVVGPFNTRMNATDYYDCLESLSLGRCELAICYAHVLGPQILNTGQFETCKIMTDPLLLVSHPDIAQEMEQALTSPKGGVTVPLVAYSSGCFLGKMQEVLTKIYSGHGVGFDPVFENSMSEAIKRMVLVGAGLGWLPKSVVAEEIEKGNLSEIEGRAAIIELDVVAVRKPTGTTPLTEKVWGQIVANMIAGSK